MQCKKCEGVIKESHKFCPHCGRKAHKSEKQPDAGSERKKVSDLENRIEYLEEELNEAGIEFDPPEDDDD